MSINTISRFIFTTVFCMVLFTEGSLFPSILQSTNLWAAESNPQVKEAIREGAAFLKKRVAKTSGGIRVLGAYALLKAEEPVDSIEITGAIKQVLNSVKDGKYQEGKGIDRYYEAGLSLMLLVDATKDKHLPEVKAISDYIIEEQFNNGGWDYHKERLGDTSVIQYAILGLWAAERGGVEIPPKVWEKAAKWHMSRQGKNGGFSYIPGTTEGNEGGASTANMTSAGAGVMLILRSMLFPGKSDWVGIGKKQTDEKPKKKMRGPLKKIDTSKEKTDKKNKSNFKPSFSAKSLDSSIKKALKWSDTQFRPKNPQIFYMYYYYTMERMTALAGITNLRGENWFDACLVEILKMKSKEGSWKSPKGPVVGTSFALLYLTRSTAKLLGHPVGNLGGGLLAGGRGLPDNLGDVRMKGGKVETKKSKDPLSKLLEDLEKLGTGFDEGLQKSVVEKIQIGDPEKLIGERKRLVNLVGNKNPEIRKVAFWALGRGGNLSDARLMVVALKEEDNVDVLIEARNALCFLSHKANGFGLASSPFTGISEDATQQQKDQAMAKWKEEAYRKWVKWYLEVRPYDEKNDLLEMSIQR